MSYIDDLLGQCGYPDEDDINGQERDYKEAQNAKEVIGFSARIVDGHLELYDSSSKKRR